MESCIGCSQIVSQRKKINWKSGSFLHPVHYFKTFKTKLYTTRIIEALYDILLIILECKVFFKRFYSLHGVLESGFMCEDTIFLVKIKTTYSFPPSS